MQMKSSNALLCCHWVGRHGHQLHRPQLLFAAAAAAAFAHSLYICIITADSCLRKERKRRSPLHFTQEPTPSIPSFLEMMKKHQHQHQQLLLLCLMFLVAVAAAAVAADPQPQEVQQPQMRMSSMARSLLQPPKLDCPSTCTVRCTNNWNNKMCNKMCNICCNKCGCVPPGTGQDTRHLCTCYDTMVNPHTGKLKCP